MYIRARMYTLWIAARGFGGADHLGWRLHLDCSRAHELFPTASYIDHCMQCGIGDSLPWAFAFHERWHAPRCLFSGTAVQHNLHQYIRAAVHRDSPRDLY